ncbi:MAG: hypothetical protein IIA30_09785, partial [Myxococcales bacterium]|nr:hypothetical protein [Myxococcales bacterium]
MDRNFILALGLSFLIYTVWSVQFAPKPPLPGSEEIASETADRAARDDFAQQPPTGSQPESRPGSELESVTGLPALQSPRTAAPMMVSDSNLSAASTAADQSEKISFETLNFRAELTTRGAGITLWELKHFDSGPNAGHEPIVLTTGSRSWTAIVEAKIGKARVEETQIRDYLQLAKLNNIDAVLTFSNEFVALPTHHPTGLPKSVTRGIGLFHWSWMHILTQA